MTAALSSQAERTARLAACGEVHMSRLNIYWWTLRDRGWDVPHFDPLDGGSDAKLLVLLERPARLGTAPRFVSRDNPSPTQRNLRCFLSEAGIERKTTVLWNLVPWLPPISSKRNHSPRRAEIEGGLVEIPRFLNCLPHLRGVLLAGRTAACAAPVVTECRPELTVFRMPHPSPILLATDPRYATTIADTLARVAQYLEIS